jgi:hypothetical protein
MLKISGKRPSGRPRNCWLEVIKGSNKKRNTLEVGLDDRKLGEDRKNGVSASDLSNNGSDLR